MDDIRKELIDKYRSYILEIIKKLKKKYRCALSRDDLYQEAVLGLLTADPNDDRGEKIYRAVETAIYRELKQQGLIRRIRKEFAIYRIARAKLFEKLRRSPTIEELSRKLKLPKERIERLEKFYQSALSYED
ncbi:MAG: hypothetical protein AAB646_01945 [Patescibacteria group bacterium]